MIVSLSDMTIKKWKIEKDGDDNCDPDFGFYVSVIPKGEKTYWDRNQLFVLNTQTGLHVSY